MPVYTINSPQEQELAKKAKDFLSSPTNASNYMEGANSLMGALDPMLTPALPAPAGGMMDPIPGGMADRDWVAGALQAEGGSPQDMEYIAAVLGNRLNSGRWGNSLKNVVLAPGQISAFNKVTGYAGGKQGTDHWRNPSAQAYEIADRLINGQLQDQTGGAMNYYATWGDPNRVPSWGGQGFRQLPGSTHYFGTAR
jgi:spore germination cell wall hydrolase CwlJ-like protein